jgi:hypothetical protein
MSFDFDMRWNRIVTVVGEMLIDGEVIVDAPHGRGLFEQAAVA